GSPMVRPYDGKQASRRRVAMFKRPACVDCHRVAPQTNTAHTLLSKSFGRRRWRRVAMPTVLAAAESRDGQARDQLLIAAFAGNWRFAPPCREPLAKKMRRATHRRRR